MSPLDEKKNGSANPTNSPYFEEKKLNCHI
jgi:hypothetical protein